MIKDQNNNLINNIINDAPVAGTDFFADSESFLNELTDSELAQINGGAGNDSTLSVLECEQHPQGSTLSLLVC
ncbi:MAG: SapB/AmfS family lanthipeptide [Rhizonema sp. NSF051]|nr:SapB/AmfS family lanthipeptide [Rhizonema sp. NSF051]